MVIDKPTLTRALQAVINNVLIQYPHLYGRIELKCFDTNIKVICDSELSAQLFLYAITKNFQDTMIIKSLEAVFVEKTIKFVFNIRRYNLMTIIL